MVSVIQELMKEKEIYKKILAELKIDQKRFENNLGLLINAFVAAAKERKGISV